MLAAVAARGGVYLSAEEALDLAFPSCSVERRTVFLTESQLRRARDLGSVPIESSLVYPYAATCDDGAGGFAYFDTHRVRTLAETLMIVVNTDGSLRRVEILAFREPEDYLPRDAWYEQFHGQRLDERLHLEREIRGVTGATLTARATTQAVRRVLALHQVISAAAATEDSP